MVVQVGGMPPAWQWRKVPEPLSGLTVPRSDRSQLCGPDCTEPARKLVELKHELALRARVAIGADGSATGHQNSVSLAISRVNAGLSAVSVALSSYSESRRTQQCLRSAQPQLWPGHGATTARYAERWRESDLVTMVQHQPLTKAATERFGQSRYPCRLSDLAPFPCRVHLDLFFSTARRSNVDAYNHVPRKSCSFFLSRGSSEGHLSMNSRMCSGGLELSKGPR
jgi:hypothetical protein